MGGLPCRLFRIRIWRSSGEPFIARVFTSTLDALSLLSQPLRDELASLQYRSFRADRQRNYPGLVRRIILAGSDPAGYLFTAEAQAGIVQIVDIALSPEFRGRRIGSAVLVWQMHEACSSGCTILLHVNATNPARGLYERLGFSVTGENGPAVRMEYASPPAYGIR